MKFETKYDVGYTFWVPRSFMRYKREEFAFEGETWYKDVEYYEPVVKLKRIVCIDIHVGRNTIIKYGVKNVGDHETDMTQFYYQANITEYTEEQAMEIAKLYANRGEEYFGN